MMDIGAVCDRVAHRLYDRPTNRDDLVDLATILLLVSDRLRGSVREYASIHGDTRRALASSMALEAIDRRLAPMGVENAGVSDDTLRRTLDTALHLVVRVMAILGAPSGSSSIAFGR